MEMLCVRSDGTCRAHALAAALHSLNLYCAAISTAFLCCSSSPRTCWYGVRWRYQNIRGIASIAVGVIWCCGAAAVSLRPTDTVRLIAGLIAPLAWLAAAAMHVALWTRRSTAPILYLAIYWLLSCVSSVFIIYNFLDAGVPLDHVEIYVHGVGMILAMIISGVDWLCFYDKVTKERLGPKKTSVDAKNISYLYNGTHFYSKITFFWLSPLLYKIYCSLVEKEDFGDLPEYETSKIQYEKFQKYYKHKVTTGKDVSLWKCYTRVVWPNFYVAGILKFLSDLTSVIPALGLAVIIQFIDEPNLSYDIRSEVTIPELLSNGYTMLLIVTLALVIQALLSQNSTHLVTVEGTRLKIALQSMIYDKCTRLASWSTTSEANEQAPLLHNPEDANTQSGLLMNLLSQDTYNIMSFAWIFHYIWAIPLKIIVILYLLYRKLGTSPIIGVAVSFWVITPLQLYIGKKISDNSKVISKCSDHRVTKISEILQGITVIKLYVWENLFNEKILQCREVELKLLNKDSAYWAFLTFTTQISAVLITVITFTLHYYVENTISLNAINVFAGLALFNQLTIPLLILPVTILMTIQAMVSTKRIKDFIELPESNNAQDDSEDSFFVNMSDNLNDVSLDTNLKNHSISERDEFNIDEGPHDGKEDVNEDLKQIYNIALGQEYLLRFKNAAFSWRVDENAWIEINELNIPAGKLIMVVGTSSSGKSSLLSAILGEMNQNRGDVYRSRQCSIWYAGQPPWILEESIKDNILMGSTFCAQNYARVIRATGLRTDLQLLPDGDNTKLGSYGTPLSGGQRVRLCIARALYSSARLIILDEPFGALDAILARHVVTRALLPAASAGRTVVLATNRLELLHYADMIIAMEDGRVSGIGGLNSFCEGPLGQWAQLAMEAREIVDRTGAGPPGGCARERLQLLRSISRRQFQREMSADTLQIDINEVVGAHFLAEVPTCTGSLRLATNQNMSLSFARQFSSPSSSEQRSKWPREVRRTVSADPTNEILHHDAKILRRQLRRRPYLTLSRWTPKSLGRLLSSDSESSTNEAQNIGHRVGQASDVTCTSTASNGNETFVTPIKDSPSTSKEYIEPVLNESSAWWKYARACGWWGAMYWVAAAVAQAIALAADYWLSLIAAENKQRSLSDEQMWNKISLYALWGVSGICAAGCAQVVCACAGAASRRILHERLLHATLHAPIHYHNTHQTGETLHRFSSDMLVVDKKLPTTISRWAQLSLLCGTAFLVNIIASPWTLLAMIPAFTSYIVLLSIYLRNAREFQHIEANSAAHAVSFASQTFVGAVTIRAGRVRTQMCASFYRHLDHNHNALLLLNSANRWLSLSLDLVGAASVTMSLAAALYSGGSGAVTGLAGTYSLLLPVYLAHLAKGQADLDVQLASVKRIHTNTNIPREDYRDECPIPPQWQRKGKIEFQDVSILHEPDIIPVLKNINLTIKPGQKVAICGRSGSGKSTLLLTCAGATKIHSGRLLLDGQDITRVPLRTLRHRVVVLPQEVIMFSGTLRENLDPLAVHTDEEIWKSLIAVGLQDFVNAQPSGLECSVNIWRGGWSGSRGSRVCVARAALHAKLAAALLLDEPGASLDASTERVLLQAISTVAPNTTIITVAHRVSSVRSYDSVVVLEDGTVAERGDLDAVLQEPTSRLARLSQALVSQHNRP